MNKNELILELNNIDGNYPIAFKVDQELFMDEYSWALAEHVSSIKLCDIYWLEETIYDDYEDFIEELTNRNDEMSDKEIINIADTYRASKVILISLSP